MQIPPVDRTRLRGSESDGHVPDVAILHLGFLGTRHTALVSADDKGMAFSHLATRGMGVVARSIRTNRILGRYPESITKSVRPKKPSSVLAFSPLPLGNAENSTDSMGLVALLTPYLLVIVSTTPIAQTQYKTTRPKELAAHSAMSAALAWFPSMHLKGSETGRSGPSSNIKLAYCWSNFLILLEVIETEATDGSDKSKPPDLQFKMRKRWKADEAIVAIQWLSRSVLGVMTITQQLIILEDVSFNVTDSSDLIKKHIYHVDLFSQQLSQLIEKLDEEDISIHGVVADAFYMSFRAYKGRLFLLGFNDVSIGTMSNWADRLLALMEQGNFIGAIQLATSYYNGQADTVTVGLPEESTSRHELVKERILEMMSASLKYAFGKNQEAGTLRLPEPQLSDLATACFSACMSIGDMDFLFEDVYAWYSDGEVQNIILEILEPSIKEGDLGVIPPSVMKDLINHFVEKGWDSRLEEILCHLNPETMDIDQITNLCRKYKLYDALLYVWNQALGDYTTILKELISIGRPGSNSTADSHSKYADSFDPSTKIFPYLSYLLTSRVYPTGDDLPDNKEVAAKAELYNFLFSGSNTNESPQRNVSYPNLETILALDAASFLSMLNEVFEDSFLNNSSDTISEQGTTVDWTPEQRFGLSLNRQYIVSILIDVITLPKYAPEDIVYMDMFVARNLPKFPQYILLPGKVLHKVLVDLCSYSNDSITDDCQLSVEYLLSVYQPPDLPSMIPLFSGAHFYRIMKSIYKAEKQYSLLLETCFEDREDPDAIFECISNCLRPGAGLSETQLNSVRSVIVDNAKALAFTDLTKAAKTIQEYAIDLHGTLLEVFGDDEHAQYQYLQAIFEPEDRAERSDIPPQRLDKAFTEQYVRLLCDYDPHHVNNFIEKLKIGDLRLDEVLPALENSGAIDAAVVLLAREGKVSEALDRLSQHLRTLEAALLGLLDAANSTPDPENTQEAADDLVESFDKYVRVGIWLCQGQSKTMANSKILTKPLSQKQSMDGDLSVDETFWVDLVDTVVQVTRNVGEVLNTQSHLDSEDDVDMQRPSSTHPLDTSKILLSLRATVQTTFTSLLTSTSVPPANEIHHRNMAFLRILRAFLNRASLSSPSLSNLRSVLGAIFSAYSYEESLLDLANRLLDKDLFVHVSEVTALRKRGWRPLGQACKGCGRRVWGPGAGVEIWNGWAQHGTLANTTTEANRSSAVSRNKGKAPVKQGGGMTNRRHEGSSPKASEDVHCEGVVVLAESVVIFSCRHMYHQRCLEEMKGKEGVRPAGDSTQNADFECYLCI